MATAILGSPSNLISNQLDKNISKQVHKSLSYKIQMLMKYILCTEIKSVTGMMT
jgi:hypothetical protein